MRRGGKDDVVVEEKKKASSPEKPIPVPAHRLESPAKSSEPFKAPESTKTSVETKEPTMIPAEKIDGYKGILADLSSVEGIMRSFITDHRGALLVSLGDGGHQADHIKQAAAIFESTDRSVAQLNQGKINQVLVTAETGHILLVSFAKYILVVLANSKTNLGLLRLALDSAQKKLEKIL